MKRFTLVKAVGAVGILALMLTLPALSQAQPIPVPCCTDFNDNLQHGWHACPDALNVFFTLDTPGPSGNPSDVYLKATDLGGASRICAGDDCDGDWWTTIALGPCGALCYDYNYIDDGCPAAGNPPCNPYSPISPHVSIIRADVLPRLVARFVVNFTVTDAGGPNPGWHHICAPIAPASGGVLPSNAQGQWVMLEGTVADWDDLLANVTDIWFPIDLTSSPTEVVGIDNVCVRNDVCPPSQIPTLSEWGLIIFVVLLAGWMTFVVVRRWRASHATA
jgi:hypothetical protein